MISTKKDTTREERSIALALLDFQSSSNFSTTPMTSPTQAKYCYRNNDRSGSKEEKVSAFTSNTASIGITKSAVKDLKFPIKVNIRIKMNELFFIFLLRGKLMVIAVIYYFHLFFSTLLFLLSNKQRSLYLCWALLVMSLFSFFCLLVTDIIVFAHHNISFFNANVF